MSHERDAIIAWLIRQRVALDHGRRNGTTKTASARDEVDDGRAALSRWLEQEAPSAIPEDEEEQEED